MDLQGYLGAIRKNWWIILVAIVLGLGLAAGVTAKATPRYQSSVTFFVSTPPDTTETAAQANQYATQRVNSYAGLLESDLLAKQIIATTGIADLSYGQVHDEIAATVDLNTVLLTAVVTDSSPDRGLKIASAIAKEFGGMVSGLDNRGTSKSPTVLLNVTSGPTLNPNPVSPRKTLNLSLGLLAGLILGVAAAVIRELLDTTIRTTDLLRSQTSHPALGSIGFDPDAKKSPLITNSAARSPRAEAFRQLRTNLQFVDVGSPVQVLVVTSSVANEGKSTTAANLGIVFAETGKKVLLVEADLRRPRVADYLGVEGSLGLTNVLVGQVELEDVLQLWGGSGLTILPSGSIPPNPSELLGSSSMSELINQLRGSYDFIILDTPPLLPVTDAAVLSVHADGALVVVRHGKTTRSQLASALRSLETVDARVLGCVLNMTPGKGADKRAGYDGYGYYETLPGPSALNGPKTPNPRTFTDQFAGSALEASAPVGAPAVYQSGAATAETVPEPQHARPDADNHRSKETH